jgi:hypothetical protein
MIAFPLLLLPVHAVCHFVAFELQSEVLLASCITCSHLYSNYNYIAKKKNSFSLVLLLDFLFGRLDSSIFWVDGILYLYIIKIKGLN